MTTTFIDTVVLDVPNKTLLDFTLTSPTRMGVYVTASGTNCEVGNFDVGPTFDSGILDGMHGAGTLHIHDGKVHNSHTPSGPPYGTHGVYGSGLELVERVESYGHPGGQCFSPRWGNVHYRCITRDSPYAYGCFDYSDGATGRPLVLREELSHGITGWFMYLNTTRNVPGSDSSLGPCTIPVELDHCTIDLRQCSNTVPIALSGDPGGSYIRNCIIITDRTGWYLSPKYVDGLGTVVLNSSTASQWLNADYTPKVVAGSPLIGKAVASPPRSHALYGDLPDVGRFQAAVVPPPPPVDFSAVAISELGKVGSKYSSWRLSFQTEYKILQAFAAKPSTTLPSGVTSHWGLALANLIAQRAKDGQSSVVLP